MPKLYRPKSGHPMNRLLYIGLQCPPYFPSRLYLKCLLYRPLKICHWEGHFPAPSRPYCRMTPSFTAQYPRPTVQAEESLPQSFPQPPESGLNQKTKQSLWRLHRLQLHLLRTCRPPPPARRDVARDPEPTCASIRANCTNARMDVTSSTKAYSMIYFGDPKEYTQCE